MVESRGHKVLRDDEEVSVRGGLSYFSACEDD